MRDRLFTEPGDLKRRIRKLKQIEGKIRFPEPMKPGETVWDRLFDLHESPKGRAKYTLAALSAMSREEFGRVTGEFFALVYFELYRERGLTFGKAPDPAVLAQLGLPFGADEQDIKRRFRALAKEFHPDTGGDAEKFIALMEAYQKLLER